MNENPTIAEPIDAATAPVDGTTTTPPPPPPGGPQAPGQPYYAQPAVRPPLRRSRTDRVFGGVCGGIGEQYGIDPVLLRILLVVAAVFSGGVFVIVYVVAWALIPDSPLWAATPMPGGTAPTAVPIPGSTPTAYATSYASGGTGTYVDPATGVVHGPITFAAPRRTEPRSYLGLITLSVAVVVGGLLSLLAVAGAHIPAATVAAAMLAVVAIGLLVGAFRGRGRWLIAPAVILLLVAQAASVIPRAVSGTWGSGVGDRTWTPTTSAPAPFELGAGNATLDLTSLPLGPATVSAKIGAGQLIVTVRDDTTIVLHVRVGAGEISLPGAAADSGTNQRVETTIAATTAADPRTTVDLTADIGLGQLEVRRASS